ncbi:uncharacterized protein PG998_002220 [Apiospora kogelbergensis]|uniref:uncharacterized protein n=1 Tax=Apiospora kogelbergensis TaxID=1337665 RepID=UPI0031305A7A
MLSISDAALFLPLLMLLSIAPSLASAFSLNVAGPDWTYVADDKHLKPSTSEQCRKAYSAEIACPDTLLGIVASMRPDFKPTTKDYANMCTTTCKEALEKYVGGVRAACQMDAGDAVQLLTQTTKPYKYADLSVSVIGQLFQFHLAQSCRTDLRGNFCGFTAEHAEVDDDFECDDVCSATFFQNAHDYSPASKYEFNYYSLVTESQWWNDQYASGYDRLIACGKVKAPSAPTGSSTAPGSSATFATATVSGGATSTSNIDPLSAAQTSAPSATGMDKASAETLSAVAASASAALPVISAAAAGSGGLNPMRQLASAACAILLSKFMLGL